MLAEENKAFVRRYITEILNKKDLDGLLKCFTDDSIDHSAPPGVPAGLRGIEQWFRMFFNSFPDAQAEIHDIIGEGDLVWHRGMFRATHTGEFLGAPPTGKRIEVPVMEINRIKNDKIAEHWGGIDMFVFMQQLGAIPPQLGGATPSQGGSQGG